MPHPDGGKGTYFHPRNSFYKAYNSIGSSGLTFSSTTGEKVTATRSSTGSGDSAITFMGEKNRHGNVCEACWGYRNNCSGAHVGQCAEALDNRIS